MKRWVSAALSLMFAGFVGAWLCLRSLLLVVVVLGLSGCGTAGATVVLSLVGGTAAGAAAGAVVARGVASSVPASPPVAVKPSPSEEGWRRAEAAAAAEAQRQAERRALDDLVDADAAAGRAVAP